MKKSLFILATAALVLASCSNDKTVAINETINDGNEITFRTLTTRVMRAPSKVAAKTGFVNDDVLDVWAVYNSAKYFQDDYVYNSTNGFISGTPHYWPSDVATKNVTFSAVYGATTNAGVATKQSAAGTVAHAPHTAAASQTDMLFAQHTSNSKENPVVLNLRHALSQIVVQAKNMNPNLKISITGVRIGYIDQSGTFTYSGSPTDTRQAATDGSITTDVTLIAQNNWSNTAATGANANKYDQTGLTATELVGNASDVAHDITGFSNWMLLPQDMKDHTVESTKMVYTTQESGSVSGDPKLTGSYLALYMKIENYVNSAVNGEIVAYQWCYWPITTDWNPGYKYTYTIDAASGGYEPQDINNDKVYDPVLDGAIIKFSVSCTIDEWVPADGSVSNPS